MKPVCSESRLNVQSSFKPAKKLMGKKNLSIATFEYIWPSSIPDKYKNNMMKQNLTEVSLKKTNRNTLKFLEETQKYINRIRNPELSGDCHLSNEKKPRLTKKPKNINLLLSTKLDSLGKGLITKRRQLLNPLEPSPNVSSHFQTHKSIKSCRIITLSLYPEPQIISTHRESFSQIHK
jgi:hypothetical protein